MKTSIIVEDVNELVKQELEDKIGLLIKEELLGKCEYINFNSECKVMLQQGSSMTPGLAVDLSIEEILS